jgi:hypothetical protein
VVAAGPSPATNSGIGPTATVGNLVASVATSSPRGGGVLPRHQHRVGHHGDVIDHRRTPNGSVLAVGPSGPTWAGDLPPSNSAKAGVDWVPRRCTPPTSRVMYRSTRGEADVFRARPLDDGGDSPGPPGAGRTGNFDPTSPPTSDTFFPALVSVRARLGLDIIGVLPG